MIGEVATCSGLTKALLARLCQHGAVEIDHQPLQGGQRLMVGEHPEIIMFQAGFDSPDIAGNGQVWFLFPRQVDLRDGIGQ